MNIALNMRRLFKILSTIAFLIFGAILIFDPPPLRLFDVNDVVLSVSPPPKLGGFNPIDDGLACTRKIESDIESTFGRPEITAFDWLNRQQGKPPRPDVHLEGRKPNDTWAVKVDRATNMFCYQEPKYVHAGMPDAYCGPKIIHENDNRIVALEDRDFTVIRVVYFDKKTYTLTMTELGETETPGATVDYFECH